MIFTIKSIFHINDNNIRIEFINGDCPMAMICILADGWYDGASDQTLTNLLQWKQKLVKENRLEDQNLQLVHTYY